MRVGNTKAEKADAKAGHEPVMMLVRNVSSIPQIIGDQAIPVGQCDIVDVAPGTMGRKLLDDKVLVEFVPESEIPKCFAGNGTEDAQYRCPCCELWFDDAETFLQHLVLFHAEEIEAAKTAN